MMGEKLLENVETYDEARNRLHGILVKLISSSLLLRCGDGGVMMHDVVRDVAISIAAEEKGHVVRAGRNLNYWPDMDLESCKRLSMMHNFIGHLSTIQIKAPNLQALFLNDNTSLIELPSDFFASMKSLMTLDLSNTNMKSLPPSLSSLQNLRTLLLSYTKLKNLSPIEKLERLEVLSLAHTNLISPYSLNNEILEDAPEQIGNLSSLRILDLAYTRLSISISVRPALFSKLHRLEEFHMLEYVFPLSSGKVDLIREIGSLSQLTSLELQVYDVELCYIDIPGPWQKLTRFQIVIDVNLDEFEATRYNSFSRGFLLRGISRGLWLRGIQGKKLANWVLVLLGRTNHLYLRLCDDLQSFTELGSAVVKGMNENLKSLYLRNCYRMECLVSSNMGSNENTVFSNLEELEIADMGAFVEICKGSPPPRLLQKLYRLTLYKCVSLVTAIPSKLIQNLQNLEILHIQNFKYFAHFVYVVQMEEEEQSVVLSNTMNRISESPVLPIFPNLKTILIKEIREIRYVFTMRVARNLLQLQKLEIAECDEMEFIIKYENGEDIQFNQDTAILPCLNKLTVKKAPKLKSFTNQNLVMDLPSLQKLRLHECFSLERLPFGTTSAPNLKAFEMEQEHFDRLEWEDESVKARVIFRKMF